MSTTVARLVGVDIARSAFYLVTTFKGTGCTDLSGVFCGRISWMVLGMFVFECVVYSLRYTLLRMNAL